MHVQPFGAFILGFLIAAAVAVVISMIARRKAPRLKTGSQDLDDIQDMLGVLDGLVQNAAHPRQVLDLAAFKECVRRWSARDPGFYHQTAGWCGDRPAGGSTWS